MAYLHVIAKLAQNSEPVCLFKDLTPEDLRQKFLKPYEAGHDFLAGTDVVSSKELRSVRIIETIQDDETEREKINRCSRAQIDEINSSSDSVFFMSLGSGWEPEDIAEAGEDVTSVYVKGAPGYRSSSTYTVSAPPTAVRKAWHENSLVTAIIAIVGAVVAGGFIYAFGWN